MNRYSLSHLSDSVLTRNLAAVAGQERAATAVVLAHIAEFDRRRLFRAAGYSSMYKYCVGVLHFAEYAAYKRILAARAGRQFPAIFRAIADGRLHLSALVLLAPCLTRANAAELLEAAQHKTKAETERLLAERFPKPDVRTTILEVTPASELAPGPVGTANPLPLNGPTPMHAPTEATVEPVVCQPAAVPPPRVMPLSPRRFEWRLTVDQETQEMMERAQQLLGHRNPKPELAQILSDALTAYVAKLEKQKFAATSRPREQKARAGSNPRYIPNAVKRAVWKRDKGRCTFTSESGHQCEARDHIEFDHIDPVARGGYATVEGIRLRCRAHNQLDAERVFGAEFMNAKREASKAAARVAAGSG